MRLYCEEIIFIESFGEDVSRVDVLEFLRDCEYAEGVEKYIGGFKEQLEEKLSKMTDEEFFIAMRTIN